MGDNSGSLNLDVYECQAESTVKVCKEDGAGNPLSSWKVALKGDKVGTVNVFPNGNDYFSTALIEGNYVLEAAGTYKYRPSVPGAEYTDAQYSKRNCPSDGSALCEGPYSPWTNVNNFSSPYQGYLGVKINNSSTDWGYFTGDEHKYLLGFEDYSGQFRFNILDDNYGDNSGSIDVDIYEGYAGTTGEDGCAVFENVPMGNYQVDEALKYGWEYVSGREPVAVDAATEEFTLVNREIPTKGSLTMCKYNDLNKDGESDDGEPKLWWEMTVVDQDGQDAGETWYTATPKDDCLTFEGMDLGEYEVTEAQVEGWTRSYPADSDSQTTILSVENPDVTVNFLNYETPVFCGDEKKNQDSEQCDGTDGVAGDGTEFCTKQWCRFMTDNINVPRERRKNMSAA
jgi:hypothetical protein